MSLHFTNKIKKINTNSISDLNNIIFTEVTKFDGPCTKIIGLDENKKLYKDATQCFISEGKVQVKKMSITDFPAYLRSLNTNQAIIHGIPIKNGKEFRIVSKSQFNNQSNTITRTKENFEYMKSPGLGVIDYDSIPGEKSLKPDELLCFMEEVCPEFKTAAIVITPSTSACIYKGTVHMNPDSAGFRLYFFPADSSDLPRFSDVLFKRLWLQGHGRIQVSRTGALLVRTIFDKSVFSPERLDFVAGAICKNGLTQNLSVPVLKGDGYFDTMAMKNLTEDEERSFLKLVENEKEAYREEAAKQKTIYDKNEIQKLKDSGLDHEKAQEVVSNRIKFKLMPEDNLHFDIHGSVCVCDVLNNLEKYDKATLADPLEPDYGGGTNKAILFMNTPETTPVIHSFAHGGRTYKFDMSAFHSRRLDAIVEEATNDPGIAFEEGSIESLAFLEKNNYADFQRYKSRLKKSGISISDLNSRLKPVKKKSGDIKNAITKNLSGICSFFHDSDYKPYVTIKKKQHLEHYDLYAKEFRLFISRLAYAEFNINLPKNSLDTILESLAGMAIHDGKEHNVYTRIAEVDGSIYIDLANNKWDCLKITKTGWKVINSDVVKFIRTKSMTPLPYPAEKGDIDLLWNYVNITKEDDQLLLLAWIIEAFRPSTPYPVILLMGQQGCAKSSSQNIIRKLIDPNASNLRSMPKSTDDLYVTASNTHMVSLNNLSHLSSNMQDAICCISTGGGHAKRQLYTDSDETVFDIKRPVILNGISQVLTQQDLIDRSLILTLKPLKTFIEETELREKLTVDYPIIFRGLIDLAVETFKNLDSITMKNPPRMADFARLGAAMFKALKPASKKNNFEMLYAEKQKTAVIEALDASTVATAVRHYLTEHPNGFLKMIPNEIYKKLKTHCHDHDLKKIEVKSAKGLADRLRRDLPGLQAVGLEITFHERTSAGRPISILWKKKPGKKAKKMNNHSFYIL